MFIEHLRGGGRPGAEQLHVFHQQHDQFRLGGEQTGLDDGLQRHAGRAPRVHFGPFNPAGLPQDNQPVKGPGHGTLIIISTSRSGPLRRLIGSRNFTPSAFYTTSTSTWKSYSSHYRVPAKSARTSAGHCSTWLRARRMCPRITAFTSTSRN